ncbi:hypothetical protein [Providencia phage PSTCR5]|uniref:Uncharacterized protein n=1 Tax=Providencia phage PSTCR5 TaxID=2783547 RepID=A0A873WX40_9CAUD|nr:virion structural protein [Providencia phage PSTCR5]QPB12227.1 hypothetical protein [Providencia phage PSTCR5]
MKLTKGLVAILVLLTVLIVGGLGIFAGYVSTSNEATRMENNIVRLDKESENKLSNYTVKIGEIIQVPEMYKNDLKEVIKETFQGRYGADGSKAVFQWIQERNLNLDSALYLNIQHEITAGRNEFAIAQNRKLEQCATYRNQLEYFWKGRFLAFAGFPKKDIDSLCEIVSDARTQGIFETRVQESIKFTK